MAVRNKQILFFLRPMAELLAKLKVGYRGVAIDEPNHPLVHKSKAGSDEVVVQTAVSRTKTNDGSWVRSKEHFGEVTSDTGFQDQGTTSVIPLSEPGYTDLSFSTANSLLGAISKSGGGETETVKTTSPIDESFTENAGTQAKVNIEHKAEISGKLGINDKATDSELLDGKDSSEFSLTTHNHNLNDLTEKSYNSLTDKPIIPPTAPVDSVNSKTGVVVLDKTDIGLGNVDNTSDASKPVSTATQTVLDGKSPITHDHNADYLGINDKASDSDLLDGQHASAFVTKAGISDMSGSISRTDLNTGYLNGNYKGLSDSNTGSYPIYCLDEVFSPNADDLNNMYGIGYTHISASFLNAADLGINPTTGWGQYIAADGNARIFFDASAGTGYFKGKIYSYGKEVLTTTSKASNSELLDGLDSTAFLRSSVIDRQQRYSNTQILPYSSTVSGKWYKNIVIPLNGGTYYQSVKFDVVGINTVFSIDIVRSSTTIRIGGSTNGINYKHISVKAVVDSSGALVVYTKSLSTYSQFLVSNIAFYNYNGQSTKISFLGATDVGSTEPSGVSNSSVFTTSNIKKMSDYLVKTNGTSSGLKTSDDIATNIADSKNLISVESFIQETTLEKLVNRDSVLKDLTLHGQDTTTWHEAIFGKGVVGARHGTDYSVTVTPYQIDFKNTGGTHNIGKEGTEITVSNTSLDDDFAIVNKRTGDARYLLAANDIVVPTIPVPEGRLAESINNSVHPATYNAYNIVGVGDVDSNVICGTGIRRMYIQNYTGATTTIQIGHTVYVRTLGDYHVGKIIESSSIHQDPVKGIILGIVVEQDTTTDIVQGGYGWAYVNFNPEPHKL